jgi:hypothetical protein
MFVVTLQKEIYTRDTLESHGGDYADDCLLNCCGLQFARDYKEYHSRKRRLHHRNYSAGFLSKHNYYYYDNHVDVVRIHR